MKHSIYWESKRKEAEDEILKLRENSVVIERQIMELLFHAVSLTIQRKSFRLRSLRREKRRVEDRIHMFEEKLTYYQHQIENLEAKTFWNKLL